MLPDGFGGGARAKAAEQAAEYDLPAVIGSEKHVERATRICGCAVARLRTGSFCRSRLRVEEVSWMAEVAGVLRVFSTCSGISAASVALEGLPMEMIGYCEIEPFACHLLHKRFGAGRPKYMPHPDAPGISKAESKKRAASIKAVADIPVEGRVPNFGDFSKLTDADIASLGRVDILEGGTPCQSFSIAGLREGLNDSRGNLTLDFCRLAHRLRSINGTSFVIWENVPGVLSDRTNAFGYLLAGLGREPGGPLVAPGGKWTNAGHVFAPAASLAWRILDSQYWGVAQRRRRVFVVASFGKIDAGEVLFESTGTQRYFAPSRET